LAGICLDPAHGCVFITFAYRDDKKILRNNIIRFKTTLGTFALAPQSQVAFTDVFAPYESGPSHQIGSCRVDGEMLYVGVGDGFKSPLESQQIDSLLGKIIRMDLDGKPVPINPFYVDGDIQKARNYVWAYGLKIRLASPSPMTMSWLRTTACRYTGL
jgi:glucose/arabinose dehydrogenase